MSLACKVEFRNTLVNYDSLTNIVPSGNIDVGYTEDEIEYPCVFITQVGGGDTANMGYKNNPTETKRTEEFTYQLDIYSRDSVVQTEQISDNIADVLSLDTNNIKGLRMTSNLDSAYIDELKAWHKVVRWKGFMEI